MIFSQLLTQHLSTDKPLRKMMTQINHFHVHLMKYSGLVRSQRGRLFLPRNLYGRSE